MKSLDKLYATLYAEASTPAQRRRIRKWQRHDLWLSKLFSLAKDNPVRARAIWKRCLWYTRYGPLAAGDRYLRRAIQRATATA